MLAAPASPDDWLVLHALGLQGGQILRVPGALPHAHGLSAVPAGATGSRSSDANIESGGEAWRRCRSKNVGRAKARDSAKQSYSILLGRGIGEQRKARNDVAHVVVTAGAIV